MLVMSGMRVIVTMGRLEWDEVGTLVQLKWRYFPGSHKPVRQTSITQLMPHTVSDY